MIRTGIYGGNFNPIHNGHLAMARAAIEQCELDELWFVPAWTQPFKIGKPVAEGHHRAEMIRLAIEGDDRLGVCTYELDKKGISYTYETLTWLKETYPEREFFFLMGADSVYTFDKWKNPQIICSCANIIAAPRHTEGQPDQAEEEMFLGKLDELRAEYHTEVYPLHVPFVDISSTMVREMIEEAGHFGPEEIAGQKLLPCKVLEYISTNGLYR